MFIVVPTYRDIGQVLDHLWSLHWICLDIQIYQGFYRFEVEPLRIA